ncbi:transmembrane protein 211-like isoform X1 [Limulus polyphemus]|uniref:Transmembrane protein 211-like isoform X1 n=1 Tax=Limulus polyphemus TaxID=6850 RepID=A0ABM1SR49_LIMPO|nr:transmembrane protein 211-like isoform X1 [Limulus polyphemus]
MNQVAITVPIDEVRTSWPVSIVWLLLSCVVSMLCTISSVQPEWYVRTDPVNDNYLHYERDSILYMLGLMSVCYRCRQTSCHSFGGNFPSSSWHMAFVLYIGGCVLSGCCVLVMVFSFFAFGERRRQSFTVYIGYIQLTAVLFQTVALLLYPLVLTTYFVRLHCGPRSDVFNPVTCRLGWAYMMAITGTALGYYCPLLARYSSYNIYSTKLL